MNECHSRVVILDDRYDLEPEGGAFTEDGKYQIVVIQDNDAYALYDVAQGLYLFLSGFAATTGVPPPHTPPHPPPATAAAPRRPRRRPAAEPATAAATVSSPPPPPPIHAARLCR